MVCLRLSQNNQPMKLKLSPTLYRKLLSLLFVVPFTICSAAMSAEPAAAEVAAEEEESDTSTVYTPTQNVFTMDMLSLGVEPAAANPLVWVGNGVSSWTGQGESTDSPWQNSAEYVDGTPVIFNDTAAGGDIVLSGTVAPGLITVDSGADNGTDELKYGYAFVGEGTIADLTDAAGNTIQKTSLVNEGSSTLILATANTFSGGITLGDGASLYLGCNDAAGTGNIVFAPGDSTLIVNYHSNDLSFRTPSVKNTLEVHGNTKITSGIASYGEFISGAYTPTNRIAADWRTLSLSGGITGSGELSLYGYSYMVKPTTEEEKDITFNYVSAIEVSEKDAVTVNGAEPGRFTGTVFLKNEFNYRPTDTKEVVVDKNKHVGGAIQLTLVDNVFEEATLNLTRDRNTDRTPGHNSNQGGNQGYGITSDNILLLSESSQITVKALEASFHNEAFLYNHTNQGNYALVTSYMEGNYGQKNERWHVRVVTDGYTNLVLEDNSDAVHVFSGSMGFAHSYVTSGQAYIHAPSVQIKGNVTKQDVVVPEPSNPGAGSLGVEQLSLEKRGTSTQYIHTANLMNLTVQDGVLGFNNLSVNGSLKLAGNSFLRLGVTGTLSTGNTWESIGGATAANGVAVPASMQTNSLLTIGGGYLEVSSTKQPGRGTLPTTAHVEGSLTLADFGSGTDLVFNINSVMPATKDNYTNTLLDVTGTLTLWNTTDITLNFNNVNLSAQYDPELTYYLASANDIVVNKDDSDPSASISGRTITLGSGYYGELDIVSENGREYLAMNVVGDPRRTWSGMLSGSYEGTEANYIWQHTPKANADDNDIPDARWKENLVFENGLLVLFGNLYQPEAWDGVNSLTSFQTVNVSAPLHAGNVVQSGEDSFRIDGVENSALGYQKVQIEGRVAPASIVIGANFNLDGSNTYDATNYYFYGSGYIDEANSSELDEAFLGGTTGLRKMGNGTAVIATDNSFTGGTVLEGGRIVMQHQNALGTGSIDIVNGAVLQGDFADNSSEFASLHAFTGEQMQTTVVSNPVRTSVYADPSNPEHVNLVDARLSNSYNKKMVLTHLTGSIDTVVTLYGHSMEEGQYSYAVFKVLNPTEFAGTVRMDGNLVGSDVYTDLWDDDATNNLAGGKVQMEIMTVNKAQDADGGNWLNTTIDLSVENGTERTVLAFDALGGSSSSLATATQIAQVNALHGSGNNGAAINSSVLSMSEDKTVTLQILGTMAGDYDGVLGFGDFQKTVDYTGSPTGIGEVHHHYGRAGSAGTLNVLKEGNITQSVNSAWLDTLTVKDGYFVVDKALVARSIVTSDAEHLIVGSVSYTAYPHSLVVGEGGILAIDSTPAVDAFAGIAPGIPKRLEEVVVGGETITTQEVAPEKYIIFANGATITGFNDWMTNDVRKETVNGKEVEIPVVLDIDNGATVTFNTHNYTPDAYINADNDVFGNYNHSHVMQLLGIMAGTDVNLTFNNELISAAAQEAGTATLRADGLGYTGTVGSELGYAVIRNHNAMTGNISVLGNTVLQVIHNGTANNMDVLVDGQNAALQFVDSASSQYLDHLSLSNGGALLLGGTQKTARAAGGFAPDSLEDAAAAGVIMSATNRYADSTGIITTATTEMNAGTATLGGAAGSTSSIDKVHLTAYSAGTHNLHHATVSSSIIELKKAVSLSIETDVHVDYNSVLKGTPTAGADPMQHIEAAPDFSVVAPVSATENIFTGADTTIEITLHGAHLSYADSVPVYHAYISQLQDVNVSGNGVVLQLVSPTFLATAHSSGAAFAALQITGTGQFLYESGNPGLVSFDTPAWTLLDFNGNTLNHLWLTADDIFDIYGVEVADTMLYITVPEPSTATLSLLALAAMAARRRRRR